jgi:hypothetical protein
MSQVKIKVRPQHSIAFPGICVHCAEPAPETMLVRKRMGRLTRLIDVPVCTECARQLQRKSLEEEQLGRLQWLIGGAAWLVTAVALLIALPPGMALWMRLGLGVLVACAVTAVIFTIFKRQIHKQYLPKKKEVLNAARIEKFSWRATIFIFENDEFTKRFITINEPLLMEL